MARRILRKHPLIAINQGLGMAEPLIWNVIMSFSKTVVLGVATVLLSAVCAQAATHPKHVAHKAMHSMHHMGSGSPVSADHSADSLNAQSLTRAQTPQ